MKFFQKIQGMRSAIIALVLLVEFLGQQYGFGGGLLTHTQTALAAIGWDTKEALFDPTVVGTALVTIWSTYQRFRAWRIERRKLEFDAVLNPVRFEPTIHG